MLTFKEMLNEDDQQDISINYGWVNLFVDNTDKTSLPKYQLDCTIYRSTNDAQKAISSNKIKPPYKFFKTIQIQLK